MLDNALGALLGAAVGDAGGSEGRELRAGGAAFSLKAGRRPAPLPPARPRHGSQAPHAPPAVGAFLEFSGPVRPSDAALALTLPGGGCWDVGPGQFTDDTELALCLAHGLAGQAPSAGFPADAVAREYAW